MSVPATIRGAAPVLAPGSSRPRLYYGWIVLLVAAAAMVGTLPGRTQGLGLITEPLIADLRISRVRYAELNFWATIIGSAGAIGVGQLIDRLGSRIVLTLVTVALALVVCAMSQTSSFAALALWITLTRGLGQSALSVVSIAVVGHWFVRKIDVAMAVYSVALSIGFMIAFPLVGTLVQQWGWRAAWLAVGCGLLGILAPISAAVVRRGPEACGLVPDGDALEPSARMHAEGAKASGATAGYLWTEALLTPAFWVFAAGTALYGLVASGIGLFNESILAEHGFGPQIYYQTLVVTALTALAGNFLGGWLATRVQLGRLMAISLFILTGGLVALPHVSTHVHVMIWATAMGLGGGLVMVLFFSVWPRLFGRRHLGTIQGAAQALTVLASALGPLLLAWCVEWTGSYSAMFRTLAGVIAVVACTALIARAPSAAPLAHAATET
jgi:MFS family permease